MNAAKIILLCTGAAVLYGIAHDLITAHVATFECSKSPLDGPGVAEC
jgi:hypothetical protein